MLKIQPRLASCLALSRRVLVRRAVPGIPRPARLSSASTTAIQSPTQSGLRPGRGTIAGVAVLGMAGALWFGETAYIAAEEAKEDPIFNAAANATPGSNKNGKYPTSVMRNGVELPVATSFGSDPADLDKPRLVVLGSGWGATSILKDLEQNAYYTVVVSPTNYFLFTPLLPEATTGTTECRSLIESIRKICRRSRAHYCEAAAYDLHLDIKMVEVVSATGQHFLIPYDKLVIGIGAMNNTFGVPGVAENARFLKDIDDARYLRHKLMSNFEQAALPTTSEQERKRLLSFVIAGGGPTGVEYAAELYDFLHDDLRKYFPDLADSGVSVTVIQSADHILNTFAECISSYAEERFRKQHINVITNARVIKLEPGVLTYKNKKPTPGQPDTFDLPFGICLWSTGVGMRPFTKRLTDKVEEQKNKRAIEIDSRLRVKGLEGVYALGDCSTIENPNMMELVKQSFEATGKDSLDWDGFQAVVSSIVDKYPQTACHLVRLQNLFDDYDLDKNHALDMSEIGRLVDETNKKLTSLPATAQVASQEGEYLAQKFNKLAYASSAESAKLAEAQMKPFSYRHLGNFSYVGGEHAVIDLGGGKTGGGFATFLLWRGAYIAKQVSLRTRVLIAIDWTKSTIFGRDITNF
ncbi:hypothetical protein HKX48_008696 [Thoreauomyces humboldtii]|nr:hypothetical protein HKX48_008696 [Thoreauomyces humboldtii]